MQDKKCNINIDEVLERLRTDDKDIIDNIYSICYDLIKQEGERCAGLDDKAYSLIGIVGVCITLVFGFGGILIKEIKDPFWLIIMVILYLGTIMFAFVSLFFALNAVKARSDFRSINDEDIFHKEMTQKDVSTYRRYLAAHFWQIYQNNFEINETKGSYLKKSFRMFLLSIALLFLTALAISNFALLKGGL
ncbi:hypothetical protein KAR91_62385 [Candidatus Pacearchaeota archaeon]|nr:hypothetical protein [Candidatus Pacearchaeota archaeon]